MGFPIYFYVYSYVCTGKDDANIKFVIGLFYE